MIPVIVLVVVVGLVVWLYKGLVGLRNQVKSAWAQIDVRRTSPHPNPESGRSHMHVDSRHRRMLGAIVLVALVAMVGLAHAKGSGSDAGAPLKLPEPLTKEAIRELVARLDDAEVRQLLIAQLDRAAATATPKASGGGVMGMASDMAGQSQRIAELAGGVVALPSALAGVRARFLEGRGPGHLLLVALLLAVMLGAGFLVEQLVQRGTRGMRRSLDQGQGDGLVQQASRFILDLVLGLVALLGFALGALAFFFAVHQGHAPTRELILTYLIATVVVRLVSRVARLVLAPADPARRLLPLGDAAAARLHRGIVSLAVVYGFGVGTLRLLADLDAPGSTVEGLTILAVLLFLVLALDMVWGIRAEIARLIRGPGEAGPLRRLLAEAWPVLATAYLVVVMLARVADLLGGQTGRSGAAILSVVLIVALPLVDMVLARMLGALFASRSGPAAGPAPPAPAAGTTFEPVLRRALHIVVIVLGLIALADLWNLDLFALAERGVGARISSAFLGIGITLLLAWTLWELARTAIIRQMAREEGPLAAERGEEGSERPASRLRTLLPVIRALLLSSIVVMATLSILSSLGVNILPLLAGAGVVGLAIGFGSQTLVRDVVSGAFFLMDDAFRLGEYIEAGDSKGTVEKITIRSLHVRHHRGALNIVPYGEIKRLRNTSRDWMIMTLEFRVPYETDILKVKKIIKRIGEDLMKDPELGPDMLQPLKSQGVMATDDGGLLIRAKFMSKPTSTPYLVRREAYNRILKAFNAEGIRFASRQVTVLTSGAAPATGALPAAGAAASAAQPDP